MSRGRKSGPRWWVYLLAGLVMLLLVGFAFRQAVGRFVLRHTLSALGRALQGRVTCERVSGDVFSNPRLERVLVVANGDTVRAASLAVRYELLPLVRGRIVLSEVVVERLDVRLAAERRAAGPDTTRHQFPDLEVRRLEVCGGSVSLAGQSRLDSIELSMSLHSSRPEMRLSLLSSRCRLVREGVGIRRMTGGCRVTQDSVTVDSFVLRTGGSRLSGAARVGLRPTGIGLEVEELSLDLAEARLGPGRLRVAGTVTADSAGQAAQVDYAADGLRWHEVEFPRLSGSAGLRDSVLLLEASGADRVLGSADASIRFDLRSQGIGGSVKVRNLAVDRIGIRVPGSGFRLDADVELSGRLGSLAKPAAPDSVDMLLAGRMSELGIDTVVAAVAYDAGFAELRRLELSGPAGRMEFAGRARTGAAGRNRLLAECRMQRLDLGLVERFLGVKASGRVSGALHAWVLPDSWYFRGRLSGESLGVEGVTAERWLLEADLSAGREYSGRVAVGAEGLRAGEVELSGAQFIWTGPEFDLRLERPEDRLRMQGEVEMRPGMQRGFDCRVLAAEFASSTDTLAVTEPFTLRLVRDTLRLSEVRMNVADGTVGLAGWLAGSGRPRVELHGRNLNLRKLQKLLRLPAELWGTADLDLCGRETLALAFAAADLEMPAADLRLKRVQGAATLTEERVDLQCLRFVNQVDTSVVSGHAGYSLAGGLRVGDVDFSAELADPGDWVFSFLHGTLNVRGGLVYGRVRVSGSPAQFVLDGRARLVRATVHVPAVSTVIERVNAELSFRDDKVHLDKLSGESGRGT
ncbi:hypothetical protein FJY71_00165, partial [candidate division WOR-3 bacterium]|nr:hypothetical protein [candidate division WOR-3 bacterium]